MDILALQDGEKLRELARDMARPSPQLVRAATGLAARLGLDPAPMLAGEGFQVKDMVFQILHYGQSDPDGLTLLTHMGAIPAEDTVQSLRGLLESNISNPAPASAVYGVLPGTDTVVMRTRINLTQAGDPADAAMRYIEALVTQVEAMRGMLRAGAELAKFFPDDAAAPESQSGVR